MAMMSVAESKASERTCPVMSRKVVVPVGAPGTGAPMYARCSCEGSRCMVWRWFEPEKPSPETRLGYCGLASRPEIA